MPFAGEAPGFASLWRRLHAALRDQRATAEEQQVLHLIEYVMSSVGDPLLAAKDVDDLDDRIDEIVGSREVLGSIAILLARHSTLFQTSRPMRAAELSAIGRERLGPAAANLVSTSQHLVDAWIDAQRQAIAVIARQADLGSNSVEFSLTDPELPAERAQGTFHGLRASICIIALARAMAADGSVETWLADALTGRLVESARQHLRLLASLPGVVVDEALVPGAERFDIDPGPASVQECVVAARSPPSRRRAGPVAAPSRASRCRS